MNWGRGYKEGYHAAIVRLMGYEKAQVYLKTIDMNKMPDGSLSTYAVANKCCGGVDAHNTSCPTVR